MRITDADLELFLASYHQKPDGPQYDSLTRIYNVAKDLQELRRLVREALDDAYYDTAEGGTGECWVASKIINALKDHMEGR